MGWLSVAAVEGCWGAEAFARSAGGHGGELALLASVEFGMATLVAVATYRGDRAAEHQFVGHQFGGNLGRGTWGLGIG